MLEILILTILSIIGYSVIAGITAGILLVMGNNADADDDVEEAIACGVLWPFTIPMLIVCGIMILINKLIEIILGI